MAVTDRDLDHPTPADASLSLDKELDLAGHVRDLFQRARQERKPLTRQWLRNYDMLRNRTYAGTSKHPWMPSPEVPEIYPILASIIGWMTDSQPTFDVVPSANPYGHYSAFLDSIAQDLRTVLRAVWQTERYDVEVQKVLWDAYTYGIGWFKAAWDQSLANGLGNPVLLRIDPFTLYPDPQARDIRQANYFIEVRTMSKQELERRFPGALAKIGDAWAEGNDEAPTVTSQIAASLPRANPGAIAPATSPRYGLPGQTDRLDAPVDDPGVTVLEAWLRTPSTETYTAFDEQNEPTEVKRAYDDWRCVIVCGNRVLMDKVASDIFSHGRHPYIRYVTDETGEMYGYSMVELLTPSQISINRLLQAIEHNIWLMGNPVFKESNGSGLQRTTLTNKPGTRITVNNGQTAEWLDPPQMHPQISQELIRFYIGEMERISGLSAITRGYMPTGRNSEGVLSSVQDSAFVRIRAALRNLEHSLREAGELIASYVAEFYDTPRVVAMVGPQGNRTSLALRGDHFYVPSDEGRVPLRFQLLVQAGSSSPTSRGARAAEADTLYAMGAIDEEALLEAHDFPNRLEVTKRVRELKALAGTLGQPPGARQRTRRS